MTQKRFVNKGKDIFQYGEWWCSANGEHCADVIATAMNELIEKNEQLKSENDDMGFLINNISAQRDEFHRGARENANRVGKLEKENEELKKVLGAILLEVKRDITNTNQTGEIRAFINPNSFNLISEVLRKYGALKGSGLGMARIVRCNPLSKGGYDPLK